MARCWIALGGNQGHVSETFRSALMALDERGIQVISVSRNFTTAPMGLVAGGQFLNAAAELKTPLQPTELLDELQAVENQLGRVRQLRWGPRPLDLDLLFYGDEGEAILDSPKLVLPHPHLWYRRFVIDPLLDLAPNLIHPVMGRSISDLAQRLNARPLPCCLTGGDSTSREILKRESALAFPDTQWHEFPITDVVLNFCLGGGPVLRALPIELRINLAAFPTPPSETIRDILTAALDSTRVVVATEV